ncbi:MAG: hypothetical protein JRC68_10140 [Deltaproteobacteria bacterium]|nr:hypothetical protein [Deltaproteobacteria bacterium]
MKTKKKEELTPRERLGDRIIKLRAILKPLEKKWHKMPVIMILLALCLPGCIHSDPWTKTDKILEGTYLTLHCVDWLQTRSADWDEFYETNPILGRAPSKGKVDLYFLGTGILHPIITHVLPQKYRKYWQAVTIGMEAYTVGNNYHIGMRIGF